MNLSNKKIILYELKLENFLDTNNSGFGDFKGVELKLDYFKQLGINVVAFDDILNQYQNEFNLDSIKNKYGSIKDFARIVKKFKENEIKIAPIIDLKNIKQSFINWNNMMSLYDLNKKQTNKYLTKLDPYLINKSITNTTLYELTDFIKYFEKVLDFYLKLNISTIILDNFEFLAFDSLRDEDKLKFITDLYKIIKREKPEMNVILKSHNNNLGLYKKMLSLENKCLDYLYLTWISTIGNNDFLKKNKKNYLNFNLVFKFLSAFKDDSNVIISFGSDLSGRIISKWGNEKAYFTESVKSFMMLLYSGNNSIGIYYGDEIGCLRAKFNWKFDFNNENYNEEKRFYQSKNVSLEKYFTYNCYFNKWSSYIQMPWNSNKIFNQNNRNIFFPINFEHNNVESQTKNNDSAINFVYFLNKLVFNSDFSLFFKNKNTVLENNKGIFKIKHTINQQKIIFLINLTNNHRKIIPYNNFSILTSSYANKFYSEIPKELGPFESLILYKQKH
ncbi:alpha-amylase family glycosyl hydrolase [Mycoplasmopsis arginini]|uniref:alpha-amylase family glycosyl hydrolase n=1 Tax=Mycoplasmopsis arginini TaxID=2094 RepID=UPI0005C26AA8|nr:alpha-amylase family glycosyl hydrolase [Mycoplasmopsis arginini]BAQ54245.1 glucan 1,6-alpha-glucosidase [Mycoplasmopsis arginini]